MRQPSLCPQVSFWFFTMGSSSGSSGGWRRHGRRKDKCWLRLKWWWQTLFSGSEPLLTIYNGHCFICVDNTALLLSRQPYYKGWLLVLRILVRIKELMYSTGMVSVKRELLTIGGRDIKNTPTAAVHRFDPMDIAMLVRCRHHPWSHYVLGCRWWSGGGWNAWRHQCCHRDWKVTSWVLSWEPLLDSPLSEVPL